MQAQGKTINKTNPETCTQAFKTLKTFDYNSKGSDLIMVFLSHNGLIFLYEFYPQTGLHSLFENTKFLALKINLLVTSCKFKQPHKQGRVLKKGTNLRIKSKFWHWMLHDKQQSLLSLRPEKSLNCAKGQLSQLDSRILNCNIQFLGLCDLIIRHTFLTELNEVLNLQIPLMGLVLHAQSTLCQKEEYS